MRKLMMMIGLVHVCGEYIDPQVNKERTGKDKKGKQEEGSRLV